MLSDVIAAIATPPGRSGTALLRVSGAGAHVVAAKVVSDFRAMPLRTARLARVRSQRGEVLDEALYFAYRGPASYTGEDMVEISTHGGLLVPVETLAALLAAGARLAEPGEFTRRAVLNGKLDLLQAEAVADLVAATAPAQRRAALGQLDRGLSRRLAGLRERILELEALVAYDIDFPEEDCGPVAPAQVAAATAALLETLEGVLGTASEGARLREGALAVIAGRPNTGKSSLFNALLGAERAIVTEIPGTTRDAIEAPATCDGFPFRLVDTAGLRESNDPVEQLGIEVSQRYLAAANVIVFCAEAGRELTDDERQFIGAAAVPVVLARTKADLAPTRGTTETTDGVPVSAVTGVGIPGLRSLLARQVFATLASEAGIEPIVTRERHRVALERALCEVRGFASVRAAGEDAIVAATHLRAAVTALEDVIGLVSPAEVLDRVFASFCVGK